MTTLWSRSWSRRSCTIRNLCSSQLSHVSSSTFPDAHDPQTSALTCLTPFDLFFIEIYSKRDINSASIMTRHTSSSAQSSRLLFLICIKPISSTSDVSRRSRHWNRLIWLAGARSLCQVRELLVELEFAQRSTQSERANQTSKLSHPLLTGVHASRYESLNRTDFFYIFPWKINFSTFGSRLSCAELS